MGCRRSLSSLSLCQSFTIAEGLSGVTENLLVCFHGEPYRVTVQNRTCFSLSDPVFQGC